MVPGFEYETRIPSHALLEWRFEGRWYLQAADSEDSNQSRLLSSSEIQVSNDGHGQDDSSEISQDVDRCVGTTKKLARNARCNNASWDRKHVQPHGELVDA